MSTETLAKLFRGRVFKPAEGVFLFHPRAMERLIEQHLETEGITGSLPELPYYLMPRAAFLTGLESENPEALAVIEGLNLPDDVILLPMPPEPQLDEANFSRLLWDYWARRFEGEIARAWQTARRDNQDSDHFGPFALHHRIGAAAFFEARDVMTRDGIIPTGLADSDFCRSFVARVIRLRYFSPGLRGFWFPAIHDWRGLDQWLMDSGLDLPLPRPGHRLPQLLERTRPDQGCGQPARVILLPFELPYGRSDPDRELAESRPAPPWVPPEIPERESPATDSSDLLDHSNPDAAAETPIMARCLSALRQGLQLPRQDWRRWSRDILLGLMIPLIGHLLHLSTRLRWGGARLPVTGFWLDLHLAFFQHAVRLAQRAELNDRYAIALRHLAEARRLHRIMSGPDTARTDQVDRILGQRALGAEEALSDLLAAKWKLGPDRGRALRALIRRLGESLLDAPHTGTARRLLRDLERVLLESRTTYYHLRPLHWLFSLGRTPLRQILPFQARLKALRALDSALNRLEHLGWPIPDVEHFAQALQTLAQQIATHLETQLKPHLKLALEEADFAPTTHRERVAAHKMLQELLDVIRRRRHLKFTDVRDIVARNSLRLPDPTLEELLLGDRLARFDRAAARALPGVYQPGEFYIKGLQQLSAPLFGTPWGRLILRHLVLPVGLAFLGLKTIDVMVGIFAVVDPTRHLATPALVSFIALLINAIAYTQLGRRGANAVLRGLWWGIRLVLFDGLRRFLRWRPVSQLLETDLARGLDRNLLRPLLIGIPMVLPIVGLGSLIEGTLVPPDLAMIALALTLGTLARNTSAGRRLLDETASATGNLLHRLNQTLVIGLVRELMEFFKEITRRFQQGLHRIEELLSHHLGETRFELALKSVLVPLWRFLESLIHFYVTVLVEPQINPIKHFPLVTIAHKVMLPFLPVITSLLVTLLEPVLPKWIAYPFVTLTMLLLPGLAGFLVWELKENWKIYAANHPILLPLGGTGSSLRRMRRTNLANAPIEPAIIGSHGETMRGILRRGFHSGTLPKAFDRLRRVLRDQVRSGVDNPRGLREARRHLAEVEQALCVFCDRELAYALRRRCKHPECGLQRVETQRPRLATSSFELTLELHAAAVSESAPIELHLRLCLIEPDLYLRATVTGPEDSLGEECWRLVREDLWVFSGRSGATHTFLAPILAPSD